MTAQAGSILRQRFGGMLERRSAPSTSSSALAGAVGRTHEQLAAVFAPLISSTGVEALWARAFALAQREFPVEGREQDDGPTEDLHTRVNLWLGAQSPSVGTDAAAAILATFAELLITLIGERLTTRYLDKAWPEEGFSDSPPKGKKA